MGYWLGPAEGDVAHSHIPISHVPARSPLRIHPFQMFEMWRKMEMSTDKVTSRRWFEPKQQAIAQHCQTALDEPMEEGFGQKKSDRRGRLVPMDALQAVWLWVKKKIPRTTGLVYFSFCQ